MRLHPHDPARSMARPLKPLPSSGPALRGLHPPLSFRPCWPRPLTAQVPWGRSPLDRTFTSHLGVETWRKCSTVAPPCPEHVFIVGGGVTLGGAGSPRPRPARAPPPRAAPPPAAAGSSGGGAGTGTRSICRGRGARAPPLGSRGEGRTRVRVGDPKVPHRDPNLPHNPHNCPTAAHKCPIEPRSVPQVPPNHLQAPKTVPWTPQVPHSNPKLPHRPSKIPQTAP